MGIKFIIRENKVPQGTLDIMRFPKEEHWQIFYYMMPLEELQPPSNLKVTIEKPNFNFDNVYGINFNVIELPIEGTKFLEDEEGRKAYKAKMAERQISSETGPSVIEYLISHSGPGLLCRLSFMASRKDEWENIAHFNVEIISNDGDDPIMYLLQTN